MKKTYINPSIEVVRIQTVGMLANSLTMGVHSDKAVTDINDLLGRGDDGDWEDEEDF